MDCFYALARLLRREPQRKCARQLLKFRQLAKTALDAFQRRGNELEIVQAPALDRLTGEGAENFERALEESLEIAGAQVSIRAVQSGVVRQEIHLGLLAEDPSNAAVAEERGHVVRIGTVSEILIIDNIKSII